MTKDRHDLRDYAQDRPDFEVCFEDEEQEERRRRRWRRWRRKCKRITYFVVGIAVATTTSYLGDAIWVWWPMPHNPFLHYLPHLPHLAWLAVFASQGSLLWV